jgi:hypothetical protein
MELISNGWKMEQFVILSKCPNIVHKTVRAIKCAILRHLQKEVLQIIFWNNPIHVHCFHFYKSWNFVYFENAKHQKQSDK